MVKITSHSREILRRVTPLGARIQKQLRLALCSRVDEEPLSRSLYMSHHSPIHDAEAEKSDSSCVHRIFLSLFGGRDGSSSVYF